MEKIIDKLFTVVFVLAMCIIVYFVIQWGRTIFSANEREGVVVENQEEDFYDEDILYDEDTEYYDPAESPALEDNTSDLTAENNPEDISSIYRDLPNVPKNKEEAEVKNRGEVETISRPTPTPTTPPKEEKNTVTSLPPKQTNVSPIQSVKAAQAKYWVLAGSFSSRENAAIRAKTVKKAGYQPEIVDFITPGVYSVVAISFNDRKQAESVAKKLKSKKIECYVRTRK